MTKEQIEYELQAARPAQIELNASKTAIRNVLRAATVQQSRAEQRRRRMQVIFSMGATVGFVLGIGCVWMLRSSTPAPQTVVKVATNLGTVWCTYSDNSDGGSSVVWPPESTDGQNNFVKSSPGYGDKGYAIRFKGKAGANSKKGFMGVSTILGPPCNTEGCSGVDIQKYRKVRFKMKGAVSDGELVLLISNGAGDAVDTIAIGSRPNAYEAQITQFVSDKWQTVTLDLRNDFQFANTTDHRQNADEILADAKNLKWHVRDARGADVDVWIDELEFF